MWRNWIPQTLLVRWEYKMAQPLQKLSGSYSHVKHRPSNSTSRYTPKTNGNIPTQKLVLSVTAALFIITQMWKAETLLCQQRSIYSRLWFFQWSCMDVRVGLWRKLSTKELMLLNCGVGQDSWESLGLQGDPASPF